MNPSGGNRIPVSRNRFFDLLLRRPVATSMVGLAIMQMGLASLSEIPLSYMPPSSNGGITVVTRFPGTDPETLERTVAIPVERSLSEMPGLVHLKSEIREGEVRIHAIFNSDKVDIRVNQASERLHSVSQDFPAEANRPYIIKYSSDDAPVFAVSFHSQNQDTAKIKRFVEKNIKPGFQRIQGVTEVSVAGGGQQEVQLVFRPERLSSSSPMIQGIVETLSQDNVALDIGQLISPGRENGGRVPVRFDAKLQSIKQLASLQTGPGGKLEQWLRVKYGERPVRRISRTDGSRQVTLYLKSSASSSILSISNSARKVFERLELPSGLSFNFIVDRGSKIRDSLESLLISGLLGVAISYVVLVFFLTDPWIAICTGGCIPFSVIGALFLLHCADVGLHVMSLGAFALSVGLVIDNAIVVSDRLSRSTISARPALLGNCARELFGGTATTLLAFAPILFLSDMSRDRYLDFCLTVSFSLALSYIYSLLVLPTAFIHGRIPFARVIRVFTKSTQILAGQYRTWKNKQGNILRSLDMGPGMAGGFSAILAIMRNRIYQSVARSALRVPRAHALLVLRLARYGKVLIFIGVFGGLALFPGIKYAPRVINQPGLQETIQASVSLPTGLHLDQSATVFKKLERIAESNPGVQRVDSRIQKNRGTLFIRPRGNYDRSYLRSALDRSFQSVPRAYVDLGTVSNSYFRIRLTFLGPDFARLRTLTRAFAQRVQALDGVRKVVFHFRKPEKFLDLHPDSSLETDVDLSPAVMARKLRFFLMGAVISKVYWGKETDVRLKGDWKPEYGIAELQNTTVPLESGSTIVQNLGSFKLSEGESEIWRVNRNRSLALTVEMTRPYHDAVERELNEFFNQSVSDPTYTCLLDRTYREKKKEFHTLTITIFVAMLLIYLLMGALLESLLKPLVILLTVPLPLLFALALQLLTYGNVTSIALFSFMMLAGLIANGSIIVVLSLSRTSHQQSRDSFLYLHRILKATRTRFRPVILTGITTILGMIPLFFVETSAVIPWQSVALITIAGTLAAIPAVLIICPALCIYLIRNPGK